MIDPQSRIVLIGYRGTGKTTAGRLLAAQLHREFVDADELLEQQLGRTIGDIFVNDGEEAFRDHESDVLRKILADAAYATAVVAAGGGAVIRPENRVLLKSAGLIVHLTADAATILERLQGDPTTSDRRPQLTDLPAADEIEELLILRQPWYAEIAALNLTTVGRSPEQVAARILTEWPSLEASAKAS